MMIKIKLKTLISVTYYTLIIFIYLLVFNPYGLLWGFPIKLYLSFFLSAMLCISVFVVSVTGDFRVNTRQCTFLGSILGCIFLLTIASGLIGVIKGNSPELIFDNVNGYFLIPIISLTVFFLTKQNIEVERIINHFIIAATVVSLAGLSIHVFYFLWPPGFAILKKIVSEYSMGSVLPMRGYIRVFMKAQLYSLIVAFVLFFKCLEKPKTSTLLLFLINFAPPMLSLTRSFWFAFLITVFLALFVRIKKLYSKRNVAVMSFLILLLILFLCVPNTIDRLANSFSLSEVGNKIRSQQFSATMQVFTKNCLLGMGPGGLYGDKYAIESTYLDLLARLGIIGFIVVMFVVTYPLQIRFFLNKNILKESDRIFIEGQIIVLLVSITNPFLISSLGMLYVGLLYGVVLVREGCYG